MATEPEDTGNLNEQIETLEENLEAAGSVTAAFSAALQGYQDNAAQASASTAALSTSITGGLRRAFDGLVFDGMKASDAMRSVAQSIASATYSAALKPVTRQLGDVIGGGIATMGGVASAGDANGGLSLGGVLPAVFGGMSSILPFAKGGVFSGGSLRGSGSAPVKAFADGGSFTQGRVMPFAKGGVVTAPTSFPMRGAATGLMGEAGPEAIMPLTRGADGTLGVRAEGGMARPVQVVMNISTPDVGGFQRSQSQIAAQVGRVIGRGSRNR